MNERIRELAEQAGGEFWQRLENDVVKQDAYITFDPPETLEKFAELIVREMCGMMEQAEDDAYHCFEPSERPTEYIEWLRDWQERFGKHFGVE